jgi:2-isopropylmalate synthase
VGDEVHADVTVGKRGCSITLRGRGHGVVEALVDALARQRGVAVSVEQFDEHALSEGTDAEALACVRVRLEDTTASAVAFAEDTASAALQAVLTAVGSAIEVGVDEGAVLTA